MTNSITEASNSIKTYSSLGKIESRAPIDRQGHFLDLLKQPVEEALSNSYAHETAAIGAAQGKVSSLELLQAATAADLSIQEFKVYWDKLINALNDITKSSI